MKKFMGLSVIAVASLMATTAIWPANAAGPLGGVIGGAGSNSVVTITSGPASNSGTANVGLGSGSSDSNNVVSANIGQTSAGSLATASVTSGGSSGLVTADIDLLNSLGTAHAGVGGNNGTADVDVAIGSGDSGLPGQPGFLDDVSGAGGLNGGSGGSLSGFIGGEGAACKQDTRGISRLLQTPYGANVASQWHHAVGVNIVKLPMCLLVRKTVGHAVSQSPNINMMQGIAAADPLINTTLGRAHTTASHVLGVEQANGNLTVYVF